MGYGVRYPHDPQVFNAPSRVQSAKVKPLPQLLNNNLGDVFQGFATNEPAAATPNREISGGIEFLGQGRYYNCIRITANYKQNTGATGGYYVPDVYKLYLPGDIGPAAASSTDPQYNGNVGVFSGRYDYLLPNLIGLPMPFSGRFTAYVSKQYLAGASRLISASVEQTALFELRGLPLFNYARLVYKWENNNTAPPSVAPSFLNEPEFFVECKYDPDANPFYQTAGA